MSTGSGALKQGTQTTQVFKRRVDQYADLRTDMAAKAYRDINSHFPTFHFAIRQLRDQRTAKAGVRQMEQHRMLEPFETLRDKSKNALIACARFSAMVLDQRTVITTPLPLPTLEGVPLPVACRSCWRATPRCTRRLHRSLCFRHKQRTWPRIERQQQQQHKEHKR
jgi:hypothetical protein